MHNESMNTQKQVVVCSTLIRSKARVSLSSFLRFASKCLCFLSIRRRIVFPNSIHTLDWLLIPLLDTTLDRVVVDRVGDELDQEKYLAVSIVQPRSSMEAAHRQRRAM